jgi:hypothetical protein
MWPVPLYNIFPHYVKRGKIFGKKLVNTKLCFDFLYNFFSETFFIPRRTERDVIKNVY